LAHAARLIALSLALGTLSAQADPFQRNFDAVPLKATTAQSSGIALEGARWDPVKSFRAAFLLDFNLGVLGLKLGDEKLGNLIPYRLDAHLLFAYQLHRRIELGVDLPVTLYQGDRFSLLREQLGGTDFPGAAGVSRFGLGDVRVVPRVHLLSQDHFPVGVSLVAEVRAPTGNGQSFYGERAFLFAPRVAVERAMGPVRVLANVGWRQRREAQYLNLLVGPEFTVGGGAIVSLPDVGRFTHVEAMGEVHLATPASAPFTFSDADSLKTPFEALVGARGRFHGPWGAELDVGRGVGLSSGYGREALRVLASLRYDRTSLDSDGDGVTDAQDSCPREPEDKDGFQDADGCPDPDQDGDGIADGEDSCPSEPGPKEYDGCPDRDLDEVPDNVDKCPDEAGPPENEGCPFDEPRVEVEADRIRLKGNVMFETASAKIQEQSFPILDEVYTVLSKNPTLGPVLVEGHTDNVGSRKYNLDLSKRRAASVVEYIVKKGPGVSASRMRSQGFGFDRPVDTNATPLGRAKNRRVDFRLVKDEVETAPRTIVVPPGAPAKPVEPEPAPAAPKR